jgi:hypothetical protein
MKNEEARLRHHISYYRVIRDARLGVSLIMIHLRRALFSARLTLEDASETRFKSVRHRFDCRLGSL